MRPAFLLLLVLFFSVAGLAQGQRQFTVVLSAGDSLRNEGDLQGAIAAFKKDYAADSKNLFTVYNMACAFAMSHQADSAFRYVREALALEDKPGTLISFLTDPDFVNLQQDPRWTGVEEQVLDSVQKATGKTYKDLPLAKRLLRMRALDQAYYSDLKIAESKTGRRSSVVMALWELKRRINEQNVADLEAIISRNGWPKISQVGRQAASAAFLIVQHSNDTLQRKYLPTLKQLCEEQEAAWPDYALMYDRIQTSANMPQRYGSQVRYNDALKKYELFPLEDPAKVDQWRAEAGLGPLKDYVARWGIEWDGPGSGN